MKILKYLILPALFALGAAIFLFFNKNTSITPTYTLKDASGSVSSGAIDTIGVKKWEPIAYISKIIGNGNISRKDQAPVVITQNIELSIGDTIETKAQSEVEIIFMDNSVIRLSENSYFSLDGQDQQSTKVSLISGELWARILKPLGDASFFTIKTSDVSAGVRWTAVVMKSDGKKMIRIDVIDSFSDTPNSLGSVQVTQSGVVNDLHAEEALVIAPEKTEKKKVLIAALLRDREFVRNNTKADIAYLAGLVQKFESGSTVLPRNTGNQEAFIRKVQWELRASLPTKDELPVLFESKSIIETLGEENAFSGGTLQTSGTSFFQAVQAEVRMNEERLKLKNLRENQKEFKNPEDQEIFKKNVNDMEQSVRNFDIPWRGGIQSQNEAITPEKPTEKPVVSPIMKPTPVAPVAPSITPTPTPVAPIAPTTSIITKPVLPVSGDAIIR